MKKVFLFLVVAIALALFWYLFIQQHDYKVTFSVRTFPGTVNQTIKGWSSSLDGSKITVQESSNLLEQQLIVGDHVYNYSWEINLINDSTSKVRVFIKEPNNSLVNKIMIPFTATQIEQDAQRILKGFYKIINEHLDLIKVKVEGMSEIERAYCVYVTTKTTQIGKAGGMMTYYSMLSSFVIENDIQTDGLPFVEITDWNMTQDSLKYNFCLPIVKTDSLPNHSLLKYKWLDQTRAIKATYNGNYITSDRAWYALIHYADKNGIETINKPIEFFYNNPNFGNNEKEWRADVFLPIK